ncbi:MAG TPA: calcium-binding protein, partial [Rhodobacteraceae bacterium]|nr:calcium-binding protein [Paracoccaceae bacterium]
MAPSAGRARCLSRTPVETIRGFRGMSVLQLIGVVGTGLVRFDTGISQLMVVDAGSGPVLFTVSGSNGGLVSYSLAEGTLPVSVDQAYINFSGTSGLGPTLAVFQSSQGLEILVGGRGNGGVEALDIDTGGNIGTPRDLQGLAPGDPALPLAQQLAGGGRLVLADPQGDGFTIYSVTGAGGLTSPVRVQDTGQTHAADIGVMAAVTVAGADILLVASQTEYGVSAYLTASATPVAGGSVGQAQGLGLMVPTAMETLVVDGTTYAVIASAPGGTGSSGALSVMAVGADGSLTPTDHVLDTQATRFGSVQALASIEVNGRAYIVAGGGDMGISLFNLTPDGQLIHLESLAGSAIAGLDGIVGIEIVQVGSQLQIFVATEGDAGVTVLSVSLGQQGVTLRADQAGQVLAGQGGNDILNGAEGDDQLTGAGGDDILRDGAGEDRLTGGAGADMFVLAADDTRDIILDFTAGQDRINLSSWPMLYDAAALDIRATASGAEIRWRGEVLVVNSADGQSLDPAQVRNAIVLDINRSFVPVEVPPSGPSAGDDILNGTAGDDTIDGLAGADTISGGAGNDRLLGGVGNDLLRGDTGRDRLDGGAGLDRLYGGDQNDRLFGDAGNDRLYGEAGNDDLEGGAGDDILDGGGGNDRAMFAVNVADVEIADLGNGEIRITSSLGVDTVRNVERFAFADVTLTLEELLALAGGGGGGGGGGPISGTEGADTLTGGAGDDVLSGLGGDDTLSGLAGNDRLEGGAGNDSLDGGAGDDTA